MYVETQPDAGGRAVTWEDFLERLGALTPRLSSDPAAASRLTELSNELATCAAERRLGALHTASEAVILLERASQLLDLDPRARDPFWMLREALEDLRRALVELVDAAADPAGDSEESADAYLRGLLAGTHGERLRRAIDTNDPQARHVVALLARRLIRSRDVTGAAAWFGTPRAQLGDRTPAAVIREHRGDAARLLLPLVGG
jgi:hypothetical protein